MSFTLRFASEDERAWMDQIANRVSEMVIFASMVVVDRGETAERGLTQVRGVDGAYPLYGRGRVGPGQYREDALATTNHPGRS